MNVEGLSKINNTKAQHVNLFFNVIVIRLYQGKYDHVSNVVDLVTKGFNYSLNNLCCSVTHKKQTAETGTV